jgi:hypothetical protein
MFWSEDRRALFGKPMTKIEIQARWRAGVKRKAAEQARRAEREPQMDDGNLATDDPGDNTAPWGAHQARILEAMVRVGVVRAYVKAEDGKLRFEAVEMPEEALQQALHAAVDAMRAEGRALR